MKISIFLIISLVASSCCPPLDESTDKRLAGVNTCAPGEMVKSKKTAQDLIIGKWKWTSTTYVNRLTGIKTIAAEEADKTVTFEFTQENVTVQDENGLTEKMYDIEFWGEGSNTVDDQLVVKFTAL